MPRPSVLTDAQAEALFAPPTAEADRECQEFLVGAGILRRKENHDGPT